MPGRAADATGRRWRHGLLAVFALVWAALAVAPHDRADWALENALVLAGLGVLWALRHRAPPSPAAAQMIFLFACVHVLGAHYTYSEVPYDRWAVALTGGSLDAALGFERNQYDRLVHLLFGLLLTWPMREVLVRTAGLRGIWSYGLPVAVSLALGAGYELIEWAAAEIVDPALGIAYVGAQGDVWDAQKDMALGFAGSLAAMAAGAVAQATRHPGEVTAPGRASGD